MSNWKESKLSDIMNLIGGGTPKTSVPEYWDGDIPWISVKDFNGERRFVGITEKKITQKGLDNSSTKILSKGDVIISARGTVGELAIIPSDMAFNQSCYGLRAKEFVDPTFLYYLLKQSVAVLKHNTHGSVFDTITKETFEGININLPPLPTQQKIAQILSSLDDKIELNNKINVNLEQQAQALFKSWFIDFEPFGGKTPAGWKNTTLDSFCNIFTGRKNANASVENGQYKFFTCSPNPLPIDSYIFDGDAIIVSGNGAYTGRTRFYSGKFDLYQRTYACTMKDGINPEYIYLLYWIVKFVLSKKIMGGTHGSAIPYIVMDDIAKFEISYDEKTFEELSKIMKSIVLQIQDNENQNEKLANLRDTLLPKLMSRELEVN